MEISAKNKMKKQTLFFLKKARWKETKQDEKQEN